jgi:hypothetical protein
MSRAAAVGRVVLLVVVVHVALGGLGRALPARATTVEAAVPTKPQGPAEPLTYYKFTTLNPPEGFCETKAFGPRQVVAEPVNVVFSLVATFLGILGLCRSKRTTMAFQGLFALLAAYGVCAALYHATLMNGFYRMKDVTLSFLQSFVTIMLIHALLLYRAKANGRELGRAARAIMAVATVIFTLYPAAVHVAGESSPNPWVAWVVFDGLWVVILVPLCLIWCHRLTWPRLRPNAAVFRFVWIALGAIVVAYGCWLVDNQLCGRHTRLLAYLAPHALWHLFISVGFYFLIVLCRYLTAHEYGYDPVLEKIALGGVVKLPFVEWQPPRGRGAVG